MTICDNTVFANQELSDQARVSRIAGYLEDEVKILCAEKGECDPFDTGNFSQAWEEFSCAKANEQAYKMFCDAMRIDFIITAAEILRTFVRDFWIEKALELADSRFDASDLKGR